MSQHFLLSPRAKTLTLAHVMRLTIEEAQTLFQRVRWPATNGAAVCPECAGTACLHRNPRDWPGPLALQGVCSGFGV